VSLRGFRADHADLPDPRGLERVVVLGGPFSARAEAPAWLREERQWLDEVLGGGGAVFGICLGAQLLADRLGAEVRRLPASELGWIPIDLLDDVGLADGAARVLEWHEDGFAVPAGASCFARSAACPVQGYRLRERLVGVQFHPEWTPEIVDALVRRFGAEMRAGSFACSDAGAYAAMHQLLESLLDRWMGH
jgi:GMP synthase (glutamine-hydrolysing)